MLYNLLASRPSVMLPTCWQHVANMFAKWSLGLTGESQKHERRSRTENSRLTLCVFGVEGGRNADPNPPIRFW